MQNNAVAIVGCGIAGISASIELIKHNVSHTIFEAKSFIGGRFYSFFDKKIELTIDNGQHLFSSAYHNFFEILDFLGTRQFVSKSTKLEIPFYMGNNRKTKLESKIFSNKLGLMLGVLSLGNLSLSSKMHLSSFLYQIQKLNIETNCDTNTYDFLLKSNQNYEVIKYFWEPIGISIFNNSLKNIPSKLFLKTIKLAFFPEKTQPNFHFATVPQSELLMPYYQKLEDSNSRLLGNTPIKAINKSGHNFTLQTNTGERLNFENVILAVPPNILVKILPSEWTYLDNFKFINSVYFNPILSIYLLTSNEITSDYLGYLNGSAIHWIFNRSKMLSLKTPPYVYSFTISNAKDLINLSESEILNLLQSVIRKFFDIQPNVIDYKIIKDRHATISIDTEFERCRPSQTTEIEGLYLAGDWTNTELPATLESAALSGKLAAKKLLSKLGVI
jgi:zeta-carotene desaturase